MKNKTIIIIAIAIAAYFIFFRKREYRTSNQTNQTNQTNTIQPGQFDFGMPQGISFNLCPDCGRLLQTKIRENLPSESKLTGWDGKFYYHCIGCGKDFTPTEIIRREPLY